MKANAAPQKSDHAKPAPKAPARVVAPVQRLQRAVGNLGFQQLVQMKLRVGAADDPLEREADRVAEQVTGKSSCGGCSSGAPCADCSSSPREIARSAEPHAPAARAVPSSVLASLGGGSPLDAGTRAAMQQHFGVDFGSVRLHTNDADAARAHSLGARAFTFGSDVVFGRGEYRPGTSEGRRLLAHELTHVVQQDGAARVVQRQPQPNQSLPPDASASANAEPNQCIAKPDDLMCKGPEKKKAPDPGGNTVEFEGVTLSTDHAFVRYQLEAYVGAKGDAETGYFRNRFVLFTMSASPAYGKALPAGEWERRREVLTVIDAELAALRGDNQTFLGEFEQLGLYTVREILGASEERVRAAATEYGITEEQVSVIRETGRERGKIWERVDTTVHHMGDSPTTRDLGAAATALVAKLDEIAALRAEQEKYVQHVSTRCGLRGMEICDYDRITDTAAHAAAAKRISDAERQYEILRAAKERDHPILAAFNDKRQELRTLGGGPSDRAAETMSSVIAARLKNIDKVWEGLGDGDVKVWKLPSIVRIASSKMHIEPGSMQARVIADKIKEVESDEFWSNLGISVLAIGLGLLAAIPTGGSSLVAGVAVAGAVGGAALSTYVAYEHYQEYELAAAQAGTDFDRARAISQEDPSLFWLALDIAGAILDVGAAIAAFRALGPAARAAAELKAAGEVADDATIAALREQGNAFKPGLGDKLADDAMYARKLHESGTLKAAGKAAEELPEGVLAARTVGAGHELKGVRGGKAVICSWPCDFLANRYKHEIDANPGWKARLEKLESDMAAAEAAGKHADIDKAFDDIANLEVEMRGEHRQRLGYDPDNKRFRTHEADAAESIENQIGAPLTRLDSKVHPTKTGDWLDPAGRTWDAVGPVPPTYFNLQSFTAQIDGHMLKQGLDFVWVDLKGLSSAQRRDVLTHINAMPRRAKPVLKIGT